MTETPKNYKDFLAAFGKNQYGEPMYILHWGADPLPRFSGCPEMFLMPSAQLARHLSCWVLAEWKSASEIGDPTLYEFPTEYGRYEPLQVFRDEGRFLPLDSEGLNIHVLELFMWVILNHKNDSQMKRSTFLKDEHTRTEVAERQKLIDRIEDGAPAFQDAVSFTGQLNVNSVVRQKMEFLEQNLTRIRERAARFSRGGIMQQSVS